MNYTTFDAFSPWLDILSFDEDICRILTKDNHPVYKIQLHTYDNSGEIGKFCTCGKVSPYNICVDF